MPPLREDEMDALAAQVLDILRKTPYSCSSLTPLSGGSANFVYRGVLSNSADSESKTVIVKHSTDFLLVNRDFKIDLSRCLAEASMLRAFQDARNLPFKTPKLLLFDPETNTQVHEDFPSATTINPIIVSPSASRLLATTIGHDLGTALRAFHAWGVQPAQAGLREEIWRNEPMRRLKYLTTYGSFIKMLENFPSLLDGRRESLERVRDMATEEFDKKAGDMDGDWGLIHGDFWIGNALLQNGPSDTANDLVVIDWELAQFGHRAHDLGQLIGDLCEKQFLDNADGAVWTIEGFAEGYGKISEDLAFRTCIHAGAHFIHWYVRRPPSTALLADQERLVSGMRLGRDLMLKGWEKDRNWFLNTALAPLFKTQSL